MSAVWIWISEDRRGEGYVEDGNGQGVQDSFPCGDPLQVLIIENEMHVMHGDQLSVCSGA